MKNLFLFVIAILFSLQLKSQVEISTNPIALLYEVGLFSLDYAANDDWSVGADIAVFSGGGVFYINGKHYFNPRQGADRFFFGSFAGAAGLDGGDDSGAGLGFLLGYKWMSKKNVTFEIAWGGGRDFKDEIGFLPYAKLHLGYRFKKRERKR